MPSSTEELASQITSAARDAWNSATHAIDRFAASLSPSSDEANRLERIVRPPLERGAAALRWSPIGSSAIVPLPAPSLEDPRMLLTIATLARVLYATIEEHQASEPLSAGTGLPLPPVTIALAAAAVWRYCNPVPLRQICLSPYCVVQRRELSRLFTSCVAHLDLPHLLGNLAALVPDAADLERRGGSAAFAADVAALAALSSGLYVGWAVLEKEVFKRASTYYAVGALGLSSLAFALQVVRGESQRGRRVLILGAFPVPSQYTWAAQVGLTVLAAPSSSFTGHMCGVLAGLAHVYVLQPVLRFLLRPDGGPAPGQPTPRFYGSGTLSGRPVSGRSGAGGGGGGGGGRSWRNALSQLALAACTVGLYVVVSSKWQGGRHRTVSDWRLR